MNAAEKRNRKNIKKNNKKVLKHLISKLCYVVAVAVVAMVVLW
jgi:hypothetical protein